MSRLLFMKIEEFIDLIAEQNLILKHDAVSADGGDNHLFICGAYPVVEIVTQTRRADKIILSVKDQNRNCYPAQV